jgi:hypothetical protein
VAATIAGGAEAIVTWNRADFPTDLAGVLAKAGVPAFAEGLTVRFGDISII